MAPRVLREILHVGDTGHIADHEQIHQRLSERGFVVDPYADAGLDPTGATDVTAGFADINTWLIGKGGGTILLPPISIFQANLDLGPGVNILGHGTLSRIQGVAGAAKPVVKSNCYQAHFRDFCILGTHPWDGTTPGGNADPEIGLQLWKSAGWPEPRVVRVTINVTRGKGFTTTAPGGYHEQLVVFASGGRGIEVGVPATDSFFLQCQAGGMLPTADCCIYGGGLQTQWTACQAYAIGLHWVDGSWHFDNTRTNDVGWLLGFLQNLSECRSEDCPVGVRFSGAESHFRGSSGGDRIPVQSQNLDPTWQNNTWEGAVECNDRFIPRCAVQQVYAYKNRYFFDIDWESTSAANPYGEDSTTPIKNQVGFVVFDDQTPGHTGRFGNEFSLRGLDTAQTWDAVSGALTPDAKDGLILGVIWKQDLTINALLHRGGVPYGRRVRFIFDPGGGPGTQLVTWDASWTDAPQPSQISGRRTTIEFVQESYDPTAPVFRFIGMTRHPQNVKTIKRTAGDYTLNKADSNWYDLDNATFDIVLPGASGDLIEVVLNGLWNNQAVSAALEVVTVASDGVTPVSFFGAGGSATDNGVTGWQAIASAFTNIGGGISRTLAAGDITNGRVTIRLRYRMKVLSSNKTLFASATNPLSFSATNKGPQNA